MLTIVIPHGRILGDFLLSFSNWLYVCTTFYKKVKDIF